MKKIWIVKYRKPGGGNWKILRVYSQNFAEDRVKDFKLRGYQAIVVETTDYPTAT